MGELSVTWNLLLHLPEGVTRLLLEKSRAEVEREVDGVRKEKERLTAAKR